MLYKKKSFVEKIQKNPTVYATVNTSKVKKSTLSERRKMLKQKPKDTFKT